jgi:hypothetical protein
VFNAIADKISVNLFRRFARHLGFTEIEREEVEVSCNDYRARTIVLLGMYEEKSKSFKKLLMTLELLGLKDLVREINEILSS